MLNGTWQQRHCDKNHFSDENITKYCSARIIRLLQILIRALNVLHIH